MVCGAEVCIFQVKFMRKKGREKGGGDVFIIVDRAVLPYIPPTPASGVGGTTLCDDFV